MRRHDSVKDRPTPLPGSTGTNLADSHNAIDHKDDKSIHHRIKIKVCRNDKVKTAADAFLTSKLPTEKHRDKLGK